MARSGNVVVETIIDIDPYEIPLATLLPNSNLDDLTAWRHLFDDDHLDFSRGMLRIALQSHLLRVGGATILIDACVGEHKGRPLRPEWNQRNATDYLAKLARADCRPDDIDIVLCTHLHADHVGWNTRLESGRWVPTFSNASYIVGAEELTYWETEAARSPEVNHGSFRDSVLPILEAGLIKTVSGGDAIVDDVSVVPLPGHTIGQIGVEVASRSGPDLLFCGDAIHSPVQIPRPEWASFLCYDPSQAVDTRRRLIERAVETDLLLVPGHQRKSPAMRVTRANGLHSPVFCDCAGAAA
jgi:glyoxylase-like metal-dependent hydrolase (beta-lactamase superfamily II)